MKKNKEKNSVPERFPYECTKMILLNLAKNVHIYAGKDSILDRPLDRVKHILSTISLINWDLYIKLNKERNDPVTTRTMIKNVAATCYQNYRVESYLAENLMTPGAKKLIQLSNQLYDKKLTTDKITQLFNEGASLNYGSKYERKTILCHWISDDRQKSIDIIKILLQLGANPDMSYDPDAGLPLNNALWNNNSEKITMLLQYKAAKSWFHIINRNNNQRFIDLIIANSTPDELNAGLISCIDSYNPPEIMQKFINSGANPSMALPYIVKKIIEKTDSLTPDHTLIQMFNFLCNQQAFDSTTLNKMQNLQAIFGSLANQLAQNQPLESMK